MTSAVVELASVRFERGERHILGPIDLTIHRGERWLVLGANGSGKSTLVRMLALQEHPSSGSIWVLGGELGRVDVRQLRRRIGYCAPGLADRLRPDLHAVDVVVTALNAALEPWWHHYTDEDRHRAMEQLNRVGVGHLAHATFGTLSSGERQRVLLARTLMAEPELILLDEPFSGLDLGSREDLVEALGSLMQRPDLPAMVLVTHHLEEVPNGVTNLLALRSGSIQYSGAVTDGMNEAVLSTTFGIPLSVSVGNDGRFSARRAR
jgi:iron complex transport system ATP-binding protein